MPRRDEPKEIHPLESGSELEELICLSIATYGEPSPNSDLDQRILSRIGAEPRPAVSHWWLPWAVALPIAACLISFFVLFQSGHVHAPTGPTDQVHIPAQLHNEVAAAAPYQLPRENRKNPLRREARPNLAAVEVKAPPLPKLAVFPTPQPLTPTEQALVAFASRATIAEREAFIEAQQQPDNPLTIAAINIQPIELPELGG